MRVELSDEWSRGVVVGAGGFLDSGIVGVWVEDDSAEDGAPSLRLPTADARQMAAALLRAADEADGHQPTTAERSLLDFIDRAGWDGTAMVSAVVTETRDKVAAELETLPVYNNAGPWCANINRAGAIETARNGLRKWEGK